MGLLRRSLPLIVALGCWAAPAGAADLAFHPAQFVDQQLGGGEPIAFSDLKHGTVIYTAHEGTTHLYRNGLGASLEDFVLSYRNQVNIWTSRDNGVNFQRVNHLGTGFATDPLHNSGFSDPDLTQDAGGRVYNTGIDPGNDALFSSPDGGLTWDKGTLNCHDGDRPWLAGGIANEVFLADNGETSSPTHQVFVSTNGGDSCSTTGIVAQGTTPKGATFQGNGKLYYLADKDMLVEPACLGGAGGSGCPAGLGVDVWHRGDPKFTYAGGPSAMTNKRTIAFWTAMGVDAADTLYLVWSTDPRGPGSGCGDTTTGNSAPGSPVANAVQYAYSKDLGKTWSAPITLEAPTTGRVFWPWLVGGDDGKVGVAWYSSDKVVDTDCDASKVSVHSAIVTAANTHDPQITRVADVVGRPVHDGRVCQGGTICVATGADRRLGDYLTIGILPNGCAMVASGDTTLRDPLTGADTVVAHPLFIRQSAGPRLRGAGDCSE